MGKMSSEFDQEKQPSRADALDRFLERYCELSRHQSKRQWEIGDLIVEMCDELGYGVKLLAVKVGENVTTFQHYAKVSRIFLLDRRYSNKPNLPQSNVKEMYARTQNVCMRGGCGLVHERTRNLRLSWRLHHICSHSMYPYHWLHIAETYGLGTRALEERIAGEADRGGTEPGQLSFNFDQLPYIRRYYERKETAVEFLRSGLAYYREKFGDDALGELGMS